MNGPFEDDFPPELLAAYADGELPPDLADRVSRMLENDPVAESLVGDQLSLSPANDEWLRDTAVPMPSPREWADCLAGVRKELSVARSVRRRLAPVLAGCAVAAGLLLTVWGAMRNDFAPLGFVLPDDDDDDALVLASHDEIEILGMPESAVPLLLAGRHPWMDDLIRARGHELELIGIGSDEHSGFPADPTTEPAPLRTPVSP